MYRFALRPRWLLSHLFVLTLVLLMVNFGFWQLRRLDEKRDRNDLLGERTAQPVVAIDDLVEVGDPTSIGDQLAYRPTSARGAFDLDEEVLVRNRTLEGQPGYWVLTPLVLDDSDAAVVVLRGWVPLAVGDQGTPVAAAPAPLGEVRVEGHVLASQERGSIGPRDPAEGTLDVLSRADVARLAAQSEHDLLPVLLQAGTGATDETLPTPVPLPEASEGPHLAYAGQWFTFSVIAVVGYPLVLRKVASRKDAEESRDSDASSGVP